ncbi:hypothetical protein K4G93_21785, partial [Mycobacterium tuberculosis]|nr:hypothetical protein [Mycobacterium tuberculosis]
MWAWPWERWPRPGRRRRQVATPPQSGPDSPPPAAPGVWREQPAQTLLTLAARHPAAQKLSLLQGESAVGRRSAQAGGRPARCAALGLAVLAGANRMLDHG